MLVPGDLGFRVAVLFAFVVFPAIGFVLRRKWRLAVARQHEINRLLLQASEEAARAEAETTFSYTSSISIPSQRLCAVCFTPTPNRCARCKSVNYCSGKCQIIHWRQGHKDECRPSLSHSDTSDEEVSFVGDAVNQFYNGGIMPITENGKIQYDEQAKSSQEKPVFIPSAYCPPKISVQDEKDSVQYASLGDSLVSQAKFHSTSELSQIHASSANGAIVDSNSDVDSIHDLNSDSCSSPDSFETSDNNVEPTKPLEENSHLRVASNGNISSLGDLKEGASGNTSGSSGLSISRSDKNLAKPTIATSGFWDGSLEYCKSKNSVQSTDVKPYPGGLDDNSLDLHSQGPEESPDNYSGSLSTSKLVADSSTSIEKDLKDPRKHQCSTVLGSKEPVASTKVPNSDGDMLKPRKVGAIGEDLSVLPVCASKKASNLSRNQKDALHLPVSKKVGFSPKAPNGVNGSLSCTKDPTLQTIESVKASSNAAIPSHVAMPAPSASVGLKSSVLKVVDQFRAPKLSKQSDDVGRISDKAVFSYESFVKLYHWNKVELRPCGLINCGNSCYANVILQCLTFTPPISAYLLQGLHSKGCAKKDWCFTCELERLILKTKEGGPPSSPIGILSQIQKIGSHLSNGRQEDAHEFLRYAIDTMQTTCLQETGVNSTSSLHEETTLVGLTFGGYLRSKIKCTKCRGKSEKQERMMDLTVEIGGDIETLEDALRQYTGTEPLDGENKYQCGRCKSYEKAKKKLNILEAPNILTIALKRFQSGKFGKLNKAIRFPEILNLAPYMRGGSDKSPIYQLYGVVVHLDTMNAAFSGHYICYVRNAQNKWYKIDDSTVKAVELDRVLNKGAYMLFYSRISPRAPRAIRSALVSRDVPSKIKIPEVDISRINARSTTSRQRGASVHANPTPANLASLGNTHQGGASVPPVRNILDDSSSDNSSIFSMDSNRESISTDESITSTDDFSEYIFGPNAFYRHSSDSDTSSSSSSSSSPQYTRHSPLSNSERYASALPDENAHSVPMGGPSCSKVLPHEASRAKESGSVGGVSFLHSNSSIKQGRKLVNISSREADAEILGRANPLDNGKSGVYQRRSLSKKSG